MGCLARWMFTLCAAVSMLLCVMVWGLCVRSYGAIDRFWWTAGDRRYVCTTVRGHFSFQMDIHPVLRDGRQGGLWQTLSDGTPLQPVLAFNRSLVSPQHPLAVPSSGGRVLTFSWVRLFDRNNPVAAPLLVFGPIWPLTLPGTILPGLWLARWVQRRRCRRRIARVLCRACGYDLRASLGRCPECGAENVARTSTRE